jgi:hypothetical protein
LRGMLFVGLAVAGIIVLRWLCLRQKEPGSMMNGAIAARKTQRIRRASGCASGPLSSALANRVRGMYRARYPKETAMPQIFVASLPTLAEAAAEIRSCERCNEDARTSFGLIINFVKRANPSDIVFCQCESALCPHCGNEIWETTLVSRVLPQGRRY